MKLILRMLDLPRKYGIVQVEYLEIPILKLKLQDHCFCFHLEKASVDVTGKEYI